MPELRAYQTNAINQLARLSADGKKRLCLQLATGGGKTVMFSGLIYRFLSKQTRPVLILVHREELLRQARRTLYDWYGIVAQPVVAGMRQLPDAKVYVAMCETANNRLLKNPRYFGDIGLVVIDECHLGSFRKLLQYFDNALTIGFTATPISASRKEPLNGIYEDIVTGIDIPELVEMGSLCANRTYHIRNVDRKALAISKGEFDEKAMGIEYSKPKHMHNTVEGYRKFCEGKKTIVFNCNVEHSQLVTAAFNEAGFAARHLDGTAGPIERAAALAWLKETPNAILNNVGILTTGFDEPSVEAVIVNKSTTSLPLWLQMTGRGSRPFPGKPSFTILDMGGNAMTHGDWSAVRDWADLFHNPEKPGDGTGVASVKVCIECEAIITAGTRVCPFCGAENAPPLTIADDPVEFELLRSSAVSVAEVIEEGAGRKDYYSLHRLKTAVVYEAKRKGVLKLTDASAGHLQVLFQGKVKEWCKEKGKRYNQWHRETSGQWFNDELKRVYGWEPAPQQMQTA